jgi:hypothetical protein
MMANNAGVSGNSYKRRVLIPYAGEGTTGRRFVDRAYNRFFGAKIFMLEERPTQYLSVLKQPDRTYDAEMFWCCGIDQWITDYPDDTDPPIRFHSILLWAPIERSGLDVMLLWPYLAAHGRISAVVSHDYLTNPIFAEWMKERIIWHRLLFPNEFHSSYGKYKPHFVLGQRDYDIDTMELR